MRPSYDENRRHILDAGHRIIAAKGFAAVGLSEILAAAEVPKGSFYHYFTSKEGYGTALIEHYVLGYLDRLDALLRADGSLGAARLMRYWDGWLASQAQQDACGCCLIVKLSAEVADLSDAMREALRQGTDQLIARLAGCIVEGQHDGSLPAALDAHTCATSLYSLWLGASLLTKLRRDRSALENAMRETRHTLLLA